MISNRFSKFRKGEIRRMKKVWLNIFFFLICMAVGPEIVSAKANHADRVRSYAGPQTCLPCHLKAAKEVAVSLHYQQQAEPQFLKEWPKGQPAGMMVSY